MKRGPKSSRTAGIDLGGDGDHLGHVCGTKPIGAQLDQDGVSASIPAAFRRREALP